MIDMDVVWRRTDKDREERRILIDENVAQHITFDGSDLGASVAGMIAKNELTAQGWEQYDDGDGPIIEIVSPESVAGHFAVSMSRSNKRGILGVLGHRLLRPSEERDRLSERLMRQATVMHRVDEAYSLLGNIYGHDVGPVSDANLAQRLGEDRLDEIKQECQILQARYDNGTLHGLGWPVICRGTGKSGVLLTDDGDRPPEDRLDNFTERTGLVIQEVSQSEDTPAYLVCFVPIERVDEAPSILEDIGSLQHMVPAPTFG